MNTIGKLITFPELLKDNNTIIIPKVQRDYAYGRKNSKVEEVLDGLLDSMLTAVKDNTTVILDFVYGSPYVREKKIKGGMIPLDGQQRLTTLFLLYYYASLLEGSNSTPEQVDSLTHFSYETRQSAKEFCKDLVQKIRPNIIDSINKGNKKISDLIKDEPLYLDTYNSDPTIVSMLNVLDKIESKCKDLIDLQPSLWTRLTTRDNIKFYSLSLDEFHLTDDLFIKMNARGKRLTLFEIFKANLVSVIGEIDSNLKDEFVRKIDAEWVDISWDYTSKALGNDRKPIDVTTEADKKYTVLFNNILKIETFLQNSYNKVPELSLNEIITSRDIVLSMENILDTMLAVHKSIGFKKIWLNYFYDDDNIVGQANHMRYNFSKRQQNPIFIQAIEKDLTVPETIYFYALYLLCTKPSYTDEEKFRCMRVIRNLVHTNVRTKDARHEKLHGFLEEVRYIIEQKGINVPAIKGQQVNLNGAPHNLSFNQNAWNEEYDKLHSFGKEEYSKLLKYENHTLLHGSLSLFLGYCKTEKDGIYNTEHLFGLLGKFESIFNNEYSTNFNKVRIALYDKDIDYLQYSRFMETYDKQTLRYFLTSWSTTPDFFIRNDYRRNQESILKILEKMPDYNRLKSPEEKCKEFTNEDWQYYITKYEVANRSNTRYGIAVWDDIQNNPLELSILNSSQHSEHNLEWSMINLAVYRLLNDDTTYTLDDHGSSPIAVASTNVVSTLGFKQDGWHVSTLKALDKLTHNKELSVSKTTNEKEWIVSFKDHENHKRDYVELGLILAKYLK